MSARHTFRLLIIFYSRFGAVKTLAEQIAEGAREIKGIEIAFMEVADQPIEELRPGETVEDMERRRSDALKEVAKADALIVGAPAYFGGMASPVKRLLEDLATHNSPAFTERSRPWRHYLYRDKVGAAFTSSATPHGGNEMAIHSILTLMMHLGMLVVTPGQHEPLLEHVAAPYGATTVSGPHGNREASEEEKEAARELGHRVAEITAWLTLGRLEWERQRGRQNVPFEPW
jgi:NAD(P)H dehydrogenase (quinone)